MRHDGRAGLTLGLALVAPGLLVAVAALQLVRAHGRDLTPWKGGGFGMFAAVDARFVRIWLESPQGEALVVLDPDGRGRRLNAADRARRMPTEAWLARVAREVAALDWAPLEGRPDRVSPTTDPARAVPVDRVRVEVWNVDFDPGRAVARPRLVAGGTYGGGG